jgi:hypothetical protein
MILRAGIYTSKLNSREQRNVWRMARDHGHIEPVTIFTELEEDELKIFLNKLLEDCSFVAPEVLAKRIASRVYTFSAMIDQALKLEEE